MSYIDLIKKRIEACDTLIECVKGDQWNALEPHGRVLIVEKLTLLRMILWKELNDELEKLMKIAV